MCEGGTCYHCEYTFFLTNIGLDLPKGKGMWDFARKGEDIF